MILCLSLHVCKIVLECHHINNKAMTRCFVCGCLFYESKTTFLMQYFYIL